MLKLEPIKLHQHEEEGRYRRRETGCSIASKEDELPWLDVQGQADAVAQLALVPWCLPSKYPPQCHKVSR
jgi:hypothetical protein